jgi:carboxylate-amine ligase
LRSAFDDAPTYMVGLEEEVLLVAPDSLEPIDSAAEVLSLFEDDRRFKLELPASQLEIITEPAPTAAGAARALLEGRRVLLARTGDAVRFACAGVHPLGRGMGELNRHPRYEHVISEYGPIARCQQVCALQVHVSAGNADRALAVYNAARSYLPLLAALAANAPFYCGRDSGLASVRPKLCELLPRQGVPPAVESWEAYAETFRWGAASGTFPDSRTWWWELRLHPGFGTLEFRVPDAQSTVAEAGAIASVIQALVAWLGERHDAGEHLDVDPTWRIEENRWSACRSGVEGEMVDLRSGARSPTRTCLGELISTLEPFVMRFRSHEGLERARAMVECNGALAQRRVAEHGGAEAVVSWLVERFV